MVVGFHTDLVIAREGVHEAKEFMTDCGVHYEVNPRQREAIFWVGPVDICEIDAKSPFAVCFFDENNVGQPLKVFYLPDYICLEELVDLFINRLLPFWGEAPSFLLDRLEGRTDVQPMGDYCRVDFAHVFLLPGEHLHVML